MKYLLMLFTTDGYNDFPFGLYDSHEDAVEDANAFDPLNPEHPYFALPCNVKNPYTHFEVMTFEDDKLRGCSQVRSFDPARY